MTQEEKQLLFADLCTRLPYGVKANIPLVDGDERIYTVSFDDMKDFVKGYINIKPYLRPMSSMTKEERAEMGIAIQKDRIEPYGEIKNCGEDNLLLCTIRQSTNLQDWLNKHHFDYRGLIPMGLAIEAPEGMYGENC